MLLKDQARSQIKFKGKVRDSWGEDFDWSMTIFKDGWVGRDPWAEG